MRPLVAALALVACGGGDTSLRVRVDFESGLVVQQLRFAGECEGVSVFGPELRPGSIDGQWLRSGDALEVLLPERLSGKAVTCAVDGLRQHQVVGSGSGAAVLERASEVECHVVLWSTSDSDGGSPPATPPACGGCVDRMGVCRQGTNDDACGVEGAACMKCEHGADCSAGRCLD